MKFFILLFFSLFFRAGSAAAESGILERLQAIPGLLAAEKSTQGFLARAFKANEIEIEHRFFGKSVPQTPAQWELLSPQILT